MARRERKACLSYCRLSCYLSFHMSRLKKSLLLSFFFFVCLFVFLRRGEGEGRLKDDKKRIIMRSFSRPKWMTIKSSQPHKHYKSNKKSQKKFPSSRIRTSDLRISINVSTVLRSTNWAIEGTFNMIASSLLILYEQKENAHGWIDHWREKNELTTARRSGTLVTTATHAARSLNQVLTRGIRMTDLSCTSAIS